MSDPFEHKCLRLRSRIARLRRRTDRHLYQTFTPGRFSGTLHSTSPNVFSKWYWAVRIARYLAARGHGAADQDRILADGEQLLRDTIVGARWLSHTVRHWWQSTPEDVTSTAEEGTND